MKTAKKSFAYLVLILGALIMVLPFFWMIISSLKTAAEVNTTPPTFWPKELVFENYVYAFEKAPFLRYFCNSLLVTIVCVACTMFTTILAAFADDDPVRDAHHHELHDHREARAQRHAHRADPAVHLQHLLHLHPPEFLPGHSGQPLLFRPRRRREQLALPLARHGAHVPTGPRDDWPA